MGGSRASQNYLNEEQSKMAKAKVVLTKDEVASLKAFKTSSEVVDFYQFISENGLRDEAHKIMQTVIAKITPVKKRGRKKVLH